ncbi:MAG: hypothetical protein ABGX08_02695 [Citromicrobium sp.]
MDMSQFIAPKTDQLTADDLIDAPRTIKIVRVTGNDGNSEQPVNIHYEGDGGKPFRPCLTMRRVMIGMWGRDTAKYIGRSLTVFRDPKVKWGGMEVGGIRISHMSHIGDEKRIMAVQVTRGAKKPYTVQPLKVEPEADHAAEAAGKIIANIGRAPDAAKLDAYLAQGKTAAAIAEWRTDRPDLAAKIDQAADARREALGGGDDPFADADHTGTIRQAEALIDGATDGGALDAAQTFIDEKRADLPADIADGLDARLAEKREALS